MPRVVLDTNAFLDCWVFGDASALPLRLALETRRLAAVRSSDTDAELRDVLARPLFALSPADQVARRAAWSALAQAIDPVPSGASRLRCTDPDDQMFIDLALAAGARALFTKDKALLAVARPARALGLLVLAPAGADSVRFVEDERA